MLANVFTAAAMCITFYYIFDDLPSVTQRPAFADWSRLPLFFGTAIFALEGIGVVSNIRLRRRRIYENERKRMKFAKSREFFFQCIAVEIFHTNINRHSRD